ncbi:MAG TPA: Holliday junction resolvase RuvX [Chitinophagales bacterium]|nr:Holliday junction resolvase RuvX [Chitinophagales bacterium]
MARIMAIDYGTRRVGIAVTDPLQIIATALTTVPTEKIFEYLAAYFKNEQVEKIVVGYPTGLDRKPTHATPLVEIFITGLKKRWPNIELTTWDETFTSKMAVKSMIESGMKKKQRRDKSIIDKVSAVIILQEYLQHQ